jgi:hypothetical protein
MMSRALPLISRNPLTFSVRGEFKMPYDTYYIYGEDDGEDVELKCKHTECSNNEDEKCIADESISDLDATDVMCCDHYDPVFVHGQERLFDYVDELQEFASNEDIQFIPFEEDCKRLLYVELPCKTSEHTHAALIQISKESQEEFEFRPNVDGGILMVHKDQLSLELSEKS